MKFETQREPWEETVGKSYILPVVWSSGYEIGEYCLLQIMFKRHFSLSEKDMCNVLTHTYTCTHARTHARDVLSMLSISMLILKKANRKIQT